MLDGVYEPTRENITGTLDETRLVANALRHTPQEGQITLRGEITPDGVRITVNDTGAGIPTEDLPYIFDRFWRGRRAAAAWGCRSHGSLCWRMGGRSWLRVKWEKGQLFRSNRQHNSFP